jgi:hypothetical protein
MRALILNPPSPSSVFRDHYCASEAKSAYLWHPLDLLIQAACLREAGWELTAIDAVATQCSLEALFGQVDPAEFDLAVILVAERTWESDRRVLEWLKRGGTQRIAASGDFLRFGSGPIKEAGPLVDWILTDFTTPHLPKTFDAGTPAGLGITTPDAVMRGAFADMGRTPLDYPTPELNLFGSGLYRLPYPGYTEFASVLTGYGCPYHCLYCHVGELGYRLRPVRAIMDELQAAKRHGARQVYFRDATINARRKHLLTWTRQMVEQDLAMPWAAFATAAPLDDEMAASMRASGCQHLQIGVETLDEELRTKNGKPCENASVEGPSLSDLKKWQARAYRRFYLRPSRLAQEAMSRIESRDFGDALGLMKDVARWWSA